MNRRRAFPFSPFIALSALVFCSSAPPAHAVLPMPTFPSCGAEPDTDPALCPSDFNEDWRYLSYIKDDYKRRVRPAEWSLGSGFWLDRGLSLEAGSFDVTIAVLDSGIYWEKPDLVNKHRLNAQELPLPRFSNGTTSSTYDLNQDGLFNIKDYAQDARVSMSAGEDVADGILDPSDLIAVFSDGVDGDGNGYVDDISGWDFFWNDNNPYDTVRYGHGTGESEDSGAEGDNGDGIGTCPNCALLALRVGDSFVTDANSFAEAVIYAADNDVEVIQEALGTVNNSSFTQAALRYAYSKNMTVVASAADETSIHPNEPANSEGTLVVHAIRYDTEEEENARTFMAFGNCTNFGGHLDLSISGTSCSSEATGRGAGLVGLIYSAAQRRGITLTSNEVRQIITMTVDDIDVPATYNDGVRMWYPSKPGWDRYFGYGRPNIYHALQAVVDGRIPPEAELQAPEWFQILDPVRTPVVDIVGRVSAPRVGRFTYIVEYGVGLDPVDDEFTLLHSETRSGALEGTLAQLDLSTIPIEKLDPEAVIEPLAMDDTVVERFEKVNRYTITVRVKVLDDNGVKAESRRTLYVQRDPDLLPGWPLFVGSSMEASPRLVDLNGDGRDELIQPTSDGRVLALQADGSALEGWPVFTDRLAVFRPENPANHLNAKAYRTGAVSPEQGQAILTAPAVGDIDNDGSLDVVVATWDGQIYAWNASGARLDGFPTSLDYSKATDQNTSPDNFLEAGFFGSPALGDLDQDGHLDIVLGAMDQWAYAFNFRGEVLPGWPVHLRYTREDGSQPDQDRIMTSPSIGDLDGDGSLEVVLGTNEIIDDTYSPTYAIVAEGNLSVDGPFLDGWPILTYGLWADILPVMGKGTTCGPVLADIDGDGTLEVAVHTVLNYGTSDHPSIFRYDGSRFSVLKQSRRAYGPYTNTDEPFAVTTISLGSFGDIDQDGDIDYALSLGGFRAAINLGVGGRRVEHNYLMGAWDARTGELLPGFPQQVADMQFFMNPALADLDGDGLPEVISGNGAFVVDAFNRDGAQPTGWPKFTGQWNLASPAVGDLDGDGMLEVVQVTRGGYLYAWHTDGRTLADGGIVEWGSFHQGPLGTGLYEADTSLMRAPSAPARATPTRR